MAFPANLGKDLVILRANHYLDVFFGKDGWHPHARFQIKNTPKGKFLSQVGGDKVPSSIFKQVLNYVGV